MTKALNTPVPDWLSATQVARLLGASRASVWLWTEKGLLPARGKTPGGHFRYLRGDVEAFGQAKGLLSKTAGKRVLVVDDNVPLTGYLRELLLAQPGVQAVELAHDGFAAGKLVHTFKPDIVLLDLMMPGLDGFKTCEHIKADPVSRAVRVVAMTGYYLPENVRRILDLGAEACLEKPLDQDILLATLSLADD